MAARPAAPDATASPAPDPHVVVLFGATGDLSARKLIPGFFHLFTAGLMPRQFRIVATSPLEWSQQQFRDHARDVITRFGRVPLTDDSWEAFAATLSYVVSSSDDMSALAAAVKDAKGVLGQGAGSLYYLSIPPAAMDSIVRGLSSAGLADAGAKVVLEKPFGTDYQSAVALNELLHSAFEERQVYRIDHFLGKEDVQNILAFRFANRLFEPVWNSRHVAAVQIDVPETLGVEDRAKFYDATGAFRDMVVTHLFQALGFVAMEPPVAFSAETLPLAKRAVFDAIQPLNPARVVRGQYEGYRDLPDVPDDSDTETLVAVEAFIDNERWDGVPILLRTGKQMAQGRHVITLTLREPPMHMFPFDTTVRPDELVFEIAEPGSIRLNFRAKEPGPHMELGEARLDFTYSQSFDPRAELEAYERLLHDAMLGDRTLFNTAEGIERLWQVAQPLLDAPPPVQPYAVGSWGPDAVQELAAPLGWHLPDS